MDYGAVGWWHFEDAASQEMKCKRAVSIWFFIKAANDNAVIHNRIVNHVPSNLIWSWFFKHLHSIELLSAASAVLNIRRVVCLICIRRQTEDGGTQRTDSLSVILFSDKIAGTRRLGFIISSLIYNSLHHFPIFLPDKMHAWTLIRKSDPLNLSRFLIEIQIFRATVMMKHDEEAIFFFFFFNHFTLITMRGYKYLCLGEMR